MLRSNHGVRSNWNALVAADEKVNKLSLQKKTTLFTKLTLLSFTGRGIGTRAQVLSKARNRQAD